MVMIQEDVTPRSGNTYQKWTEEFYKSGEIELTCGRG